MSVITWLPHVNRGRGRRWCACCESLALKLLFVSVYNIEKVFWEIEKYEIYWVERQNYCYTGSMLTSILPGGSLIKTISLLSVVLYQFFHRLSPRLVGNYHPSFTPCKVLNTGRFEDSKYLLDSGSASLCTGLMRHLPWCKCVCHQKI